MKYFMINVPLRKYGYSFLVKTNDTALDEESIIDAALDAGLFEEDEDAMVAFAEEASQYDIDHFPKNATEI